MSACLDSLRAQDFADFEVIVFDDGSTDASVRIAEDRARLDPRIRVIRSPKVGIVEALNGACAQARGAYIARMDADDIARPDRFTRQIEYMKQHPEVALCGSLVEIFGEQIGTGRQRYEQWINAVISHDEIVREIFVECPIPHPTFFMRKQAFEKAGRYRGSEWAEDYDLVLRMFLLGFRFGKVDETLLQWRHDGQRLSMTDPRYSLEQFRNLKRHFLLESYLRDRPVFHQWGAGEVGKAWLREWEGPRPQAVVDLHPRKIGKRIHGIEVIEPQDLPGPGSTFTVVAVGAPGAREEIRQWFCEREYAELEDFIFLA